MVTNIEQKTLRKIAEKCGTPAYIYSEEVLIRNVNRIKEAIAKSGIKNKVKINIAYFANSNPHLISILARQGLGITLQCIEENEHLKKNIINTEKVVAPTHLSKKDLRYFINEGLKIYLGTFGNIREAINEKQDSIFVRVDLSPESNQRQGIKIAQFGELKALLDESKIKLRGIHIYPGTKNKLDAHLRYQIKSLQCLRYFPEIKEINLGGGFYYEYEEEMEKCHFDWDTYFNELKNNIERYQVSEEVIFTIEPGRDIFADAGFLFIKINGIEKMCGKEIYEIFTDGSYVHMPSATIGGRQHKISFFDSDFNKIILDAHAEYSGFLSGNTTLSSDKLFPGIVYFPFCLKEGDYIILHDVGAYCATQHMEFLNKAPNPEILLKLKGMYLISAKGSLIDKIRNLVPTPLNLEAFHNESRE